MQKLLTYSGIITKLKGMESNLLTDSDYDDLCNAHSVSDFILYLKNNHAYTELLEQLNESLVHRGEVESSLHLAAAYDFSKLYLFATLKQRSLLSIFFYRFEADFIKHRLTELFFYKNTSVTFERYHSLFETHSKLNLVELNKSETLDQFIQALRGTIYEKPLQTIYESKSPTLYDYHTQVDIYYFITIWNYIKKLKHKKDRKLYQDIIGTQIDLQNIMWVYRIKCFYSMSESYINSRLIPIHYNLPESTLYSMVKAATIEEFLSLLEHSSYAKLTKNLDQVSLEHNFLLYRSMFLKKLRNKYPISIIAILYYLHAKETEVDHLTTILECIRYKIAPSEIKQYLSYTPST